MTLYIIQLLRLYPASIKLLVHHNHNVNIGQGHRSRSTRSRSIEQMRE